MDPRIITLYMVYEVRLVHMKVSGVVDGMLVVRHYSAL